MACTKLQKEMKISLLTVLSCVVVGGIIFSTFQQSNSFYSVTNNNHPYHQNPKKETPSHLHIQRREQLWWVASPLLFWFLSPFPLYHTLIRSPHAVTCFNKLHLLSTAMLLSLWDVVWQTVYLHRETHHFAAWESNLPCSCCYFVLLTLEMVNFRCLLEICNLPCLLCSRMRTRAYG